MEEKEIKALIQAIDKLLGDPLQAQPAEIDALYAELGGGIDPAQSVYDLAAAAAQQFRTKGTPVPPHVAEALKYAKKSLGVGNLETTTPSEAVGEILHPTSGPISQVSYAFRNRKKQTKKDSEILERLSNEVKTDWSKGSDS
jgi:hypothetical protein